MSKARRALNVHSDVQTTCNNMLSDDLRRKFTGNSGFYIFMARYRQRIFLPRNLNAVLATVAPHDKETRSRSNGNPPEEQNLAPERRRRKIGINEAMHKVKPKIKNTGGADEPILKIEAKSLKRMRNFKPRNMMSKEQNPENGLAKDENVMTFRCRCAISICEKIDVPIREKRPPPRRPLYSNSEMCTVTLDSEDTATIHMDDPFILGVSKLFVLTSRSQSKESMLTESYEATVTLEATDSKSPWPPLLHTTAHTFGGDPLNVQLVTQIKSLPLAPSTPWHEMTIEGSETNITPNLSIELDCGWSIPSALDVQVNQSRKTIQAQRLPTPISEQGRELSTNAQNISVAWHFAGSMDKRHTSYNLSEPNSRGEQIFSCSGFTCPLCDGREFQSCSFLHFHLITSHELFTFKVKQRKPSTGINSGGDEKYDLIVDIMVDLGKEPMVTRASDKVPDHRTFDWIKPAKKFDINRILKGDWSWLNEKKNLAASVYRRGNSEPLQPVMRVIDLDNVPPILPRPHRKMVVPEPKTVVEGPVFLRSKSKRFVRPGEELSESDDDADETWIQMKHDETLDDFTDVAHAERDFMKLWDKHMFIEKPIGFCHIPHAAIRFAQNHSEYLGRSHLLAEFWKHMLNLIQFKVIDTTVLKRCMEIVKGGKSEWSSVDKSEWGVGMYGPLPLDGKSMQSRPESPTPAPRKKLRGRPKAKPAAPNVDDMDIDSSSETSPQSAVKAEPSRQKTFGPSVPEPPNYGFCICGQGWRRIDMIRCNGKDCEKQWFHRSCFPGVPRWPDNFHCPVCKAPDVAMEDVSAEP
ncbi:VEFS-Box of polycomb protein-domain-containing protein [Geopyxis carbonaria]|nr:VEFS-Box of polycomb protein-domain-containing protein [Geopyxis carbonaria]